MFGKFFAYLWGALHSKTCWVNFGYSVLAILDYAGQIDFIKNNPDVAFLVVTVSNVLLRFVTRVPLEKKGSYVVSGANYRSKDYR